MLLLGWMQEGASNVVNNLPYKKKLFMLAIYTAPVLAALSWMTPRAAVSARRLAELSI